MVNKDDGKLFYCPCGSAVKYLVVSLGLLLFNRACGMGEGQDV